MRVADFIAKRLLFLGVSDVYMVTGGAAMHLNDALGRVFQKSVHHLHHEQSCAIAAEAFARINGRPCLVNVTAGPGAINAINGVFGAFVDSLPVIVVSGQAKRETLLTNSGVANLRQLGDQEVDIVRMVGGICKSAELIQDPLSIHQQINHAFLTATTARPGPVWLDVPVDVQSYLLPEHFDDLVTESLDDCDVATRFPECSDRDLDVLARHLLTDHRPVLYVGSGVRLGNAYQELLSFLEEWPVACVTGWNSNDLLWDAHPCYCGRPGTVGNRSGNFAVQFSACVLTVGCRLNIRQVSFNWNSFARDAWTCHLDIDLAELDKPTLKTDLKIHATVSGFFPRLAEQMQRVAKEQGIRLDRVKQHWKEWREWLKETLHCYSVVSHAMAVKEGVVNPYRLVDRLTSHLEEDSITVCADGTACVVGFQAAIFKAGQRMFHNSGCASMGYELPAAIGAYHATGSLITCLAGDGSIMMNLQELSIIGGHQLPIKIILLNNQGYHSIRQTQQNYFPDHPVGCGSESGLPFPNFAHLCRGFGISYALLNDEKLLDQAILSLYADQLPSMLEVVLDLSQDFAPKLASKKLDDGSMVTAELEDMSPLLGDDLLRLLRQEARAIQAPCS